MTDIDRFEAQFAVRLRAHAATAVRPSDAGEIAQAAITSARGEAGAGGGGWVGRTPRPVALALLLLLVAMLAVAAVVGARLLLPTPLPFPADASGTFLAAGNVSIPRADHDAMVLEDGRVLVINGVAERGGPQEFEPLPPEIFNPRTGKSTLLPPIDIPFDHDRGDRDTYSTTLLQDGRVLVAGGRPGGFLQVPSINHAVLYDPATGTSTPTGPMTQARAEHVAVRLADGRVLVVGGTGPREGGGEVSLASAELYDPDTGTFSPTGDMTTDRALADYATTNIPLTATLLPSGRVLVVGGIRRDVGLEEAGSEPEVGGPDEIYDPASGTFASVLTAGSLESIPTIHLPGDGKVYRYDLSTGRATDVTPQPAHLVAEYGPFCEDLPWGCRTGMVPTFLADSRILLTGGTIFVSDRPGTGGSHHGEPMAAGEYFDPASGAVAPTGPIIEPRRDHSATLLPDGRVLLLGGILVQRAEPGIEEDPPQVYLTSAEIFTP